MIGSGAIERVLYKFKDYPLVNRIERNYRSLPFQGNPALLDFPHNPISKNKYIVVGLPKSGNTWLMSLLGNILDVDYTHINNNSGGICMSHGRCRQLMYKRDIVRAVYIIRDVRDVICSFYPYSQTADYREHQDKTSYFNNIEEFYREYFLGYIDKRYQWNTHPDDYVELGIPIIRYEDLWTNPILVLEKLLKRWGLPINKEKIEESIKLNSINKLKEEGKSVFRDIPTTHFRKGGSNYIEEMPEQVINDVEENFAEFLKRWGYKLS
jgi:hypothetical protein